MCIRPARDVTCNVGPGVWQGYELPAVGILGLCDLLNDIRMYTFSERTPVLSVQENGYILWLQKQVLHWPRLTAGWAMVASQEEMACG